MFAMTREMLRSPRVLRRRLGEGLDFLKFLTARRQAPPPVRT
jgi:hypothetical protein